MLEEIDNPSELKLSKKRRGILQKGWLGWLWDGKVKYRRKNEMEINYGLVAPVVKVERSEEGSCPKAKSKKRCAKKRSKRKR